MEHVLLDGKVRLIQANALSIPLEDGSVNCCVTSPPYWGLRNYLGDEDQLGQEKTPDEYVANMVAVFREVRRVLRADGTLWLNIGDSYAAQRGGTHMPAETLAGGKNGKTDEGECVNRGRSDGYSPSRNASAIGLKHKDLVGIPWMVAFALRADGWYLRQDIIWCLSGGTWVYARTQKGDMPIMVRDLARLRAGTAQLWNGEKWTRLLGMSKSKRRGTELEIVLRSGERISCTPTHKFPTSRGLLEAADIRAGDKLTSCRLPEPSNPKSSVIDDDAAWLAGLYVAEGSMSGDTIQISGHSKEVSRWVRLCAIAAKYGGSCTRSVEGNSMDLRLYGKVLVAIISELVTGHTAKNKRFAPVVWRHSDSFVGAMLSGYLSGDGCYSQERWRLGFTRNYNLERDLRTACARLGYTITLNPSTVAYKGKRFPIFKGEIRETRSGHHNEKDRNEVMEIRKARCREVYDLGVEDEPHVFALASGVLTHNSKSNPMPESVTDRCTKAHEYLFLLSKSPRYYYDQDAIKEPSVSGDLRKPYAPGQVDARGNGHDRGGGTFRKTDKQSMVGKRTYTGFNDRWDAREETDPLKFRNKRDVWSVATHPYKEAHFATFPPKLIEPCVLAGCPENGLVLDPFGGSGTTARVCVDNNRRAVLLDINYKEEEGSYLEMAKRRILSPAKQPKPAKKEKVDNWPSLLDFCEVQ